MEWKTVLLIINVTVNDINKIIGIIIGFMNDNDIAHDINNLGGY